MYIPSPARQTYIFMMCIGFGFVTGFFYHLLRFIRKSFFTFRKAVLVQDLLFSVITTFGTFCFLLCCNDGEIRLFVFCGLALGLFFYYISFGIFVARFLDIVSFALSRWLNSLRRVLRTIIQWVKNKF